MPAVIDEYSIATVPIELRFNDTGLATGTAFVWEHSGDHYLITNWHNVSGRDPNTGRHLSKTAAEPDNIRGYFNTKGAYMGFKHHVGMKIRNDDGQVAWRVHPTYKREIDVVALPLTGPLTDTIEFRPINKAPSADIALSIAMDVFVLGYPFGAGPTGLPIWKRGSIASEPVLVPEVERHFHIDTASRPGMSGSPVIVRASNYRDSAGKPILRAGPATKLIGVYSGRLSTQDPLEAQIGIVWPAGFIDEIIAGGLTEYG